MEPKKVEYRVRPVTRYVVTKYEETDYTGGVETKGEYNNPGIAYEVAYALAKDRQRQLGWAPGDERIIYPDHSFKQLN